MRRAFLWVPWLLLFGSSFAIGQVAASSDGKTTEAPSAPEQIAAKQARLSAIIAELRGRRLVGWSMAKLARRAGSLDLLEAYARRGEFTVHHELWPRDQPLFIDDQGTRCALAHVLDGVGEDALVVALAERCNDAYLNEIDDDPVLLSVLDQLGLTLDEAAYIQGPGIGGPRGTDTGSREDRQERRQERQERRERREERERRRDERGGGNDGGGNDGGGNDGGGNDGGGNDGGGNDGGGGNDDGGNDGPQTGGRLPPPVTGGDKGSLATGGAPSGPPPTAGTRAGVTGVSRRSQATPTFTVDGWWSANLDRFLPVREIYRGGVALTPQAMTESLALSAAEHAALREQLRAVAVADVDLRATALGMWARTSSGDDAAAIVEATAQFLADPGQPHREWAPVLLAMLENPAASPLLQSLVADDAEGRRRLGKSSAVPESMRALAALALGKCGDAVPTLKAALRDQPAAHVDLAAACVVGLGLAARRPAEQYAATVALLGALDDEALPATVRAQVPVALALADAQA
ncbi:MAG: hypothetical protein FJ293_16560, partial [Planctomycetes bacterium]|nr:hypothetical protein [Planctomycetota bacterium]